MKALTLKAFRATYLLCTSNGCGICLCFFEKQILDI